MPNKADELRRISEGAQAELDRRKRESQRRSEERRRQWQHDVDEFGYGFHPSILTEKIAAQTNDRN